MKVLNSIFATFIVAFFAICVNAQNISDIKKVDFTNFTHRIKTVSVKMKDGLQTDACKKDAEGLPSGDIWNARKESIVFGDFDGDGKDEAVVPMIANICGANMITDEAVLIYTLEAGKVVKLPEFEYVDAGCREGEEGCNYDRVLGVTVEYDATAKAFVVSNYFATADDARCCPSFLRKAWFRRDGAKIVEFKKGKLEVVKQEEL